MSTQTKELTEVFKEAPVKTSMSGYVMLSDSNGEPSRITAFNMRGTNLANAETAGSTMTLADFLRKYIQGKSPGWVATDTDYSNVIKWHLRLKGSLTVPLQEYMVFVTKCKGSPDNPWSNFAFFLLPTTGNIAYRVSYITDSTAANYTVSVAQWTMTTV